MKKLRMLLPIGAVIGMLAVGTAFPAMAAVVDTDMAKFVRGNYCRRSCIYLSKRGLSGLKERGHE